MIVKIKNFDELDTVLENSFSAVRKEVRDVKKSVDETQKRNNQNITKLQTRQTSVDSDVKSLKSSLKEEWKKEISANSLQAEKKFSVLKNSIDKKNSDFVKELGAKSSTLNKNQEQWKININKRFEDLKSDLQTQKVSDGKRFENFAVNVQKDVEEAKKQHRRDLGVTDAKTDTLSKELKQLKSELLTLEKGQGENIKSVREEVAKSTRQSNKYTDTKILDLDSNVENVKKDIVKLMGTLRDKLVSKESFEKRNQMIETMLRDTLEQTKDLDKAKLSYYARNSFSTELEEIKTSLTNESKQNQAARKEILNLSEQVSSKVPYSDLQKIRANLDEQSQKLSTLHDSLDGIAIKTPTKLELSTVEENLRSFSSKIDNNFTLHQEDIANIRDDLKEIKMWQKELSHMSETLEKTEQKTLENSSRIEVMLSTAPKQHLSVQELIQEEEPVEVTTSSPQMEKTNLVAEVEEMLLEKEKKEEPAKVTFFTRFKKGLIDFFFEEEVEVEQVDEKRGVEPAPLLEVSPPLPLKEEEEEENNWEEEATKEIMGEEKSKKPRKSKKATVDEVPSQDPKSRKKKYKTQEKGEGGQEEMYYPEDYFY